MLLRSTLMCGAVWLLALDLVSAAQLVVIDSRNTDFSVGAVVDGSKPFSLADGSRVTFLSQTGKTISLIGPYNGAPDVSVGVDDAGVVETISGLLGDTTANSELAVFRGATAGQTSPYAADVSRSGTYCVLRDATLRRRNSRRKDEITLSLSTGERVTQTWPAKIKSVSWPERLPLRDGVAYQARSKLTGEVENVSLRLIPGGLPSDAHRATWMARNGCERQARKVIRDLADQ